MYPTSFLLPTIYLSIYLIYTSPGSVAAFVTSWPRRGGQSTYLSFCPDFYRSIYHPTIYLSIHLFYLSFLRFRCSISNFLTKTAWPIHLSFFLSRYLSIIKPSIYLSIHLSIFPSPGSIAASATSPPRRGSASAATRPANTATSSAPSSRSREPVQGEG